MTSRGLLLASALLIGCGGKTIEGETNTTDGGSSDTSAPADGNISITTDGGGTADYCSAAAERASRCTGSSFDLAECQQQVACYQRALRSELYTPLLTCLATRPCGKSDDSCVAEQAQKYITDPAVQEFVKACNEKRTACMNGFSDDYCGYTFGLMNDALRNNVTTCISRSCAEVRPCFDTVFAAVGCGN